MYWCPSATYVNETSLEWMGDHSDNNTFGLCTATYFPESNGCPDHYYQVRPFFLVHTYYIYRLSYDFVIFFRYLENVLEFFTPQRILLSLETNAKMKALI